MKAVFLIFFVIVVLPLAVNAQREKSVCLEPLKNDEPSDAIILNVCNQGRGMTALPSLRLYFRLYQSGRVEYEVSSDCNKLDLKKTKINAKEVAEIIKLGEESGFQNAKSEYPRFQIWTDSGLETTIIFKDKTQKEKKIVINNYSSFDKENEKHYPSSLLKILQKVDELRPNDK